MNRSQGPRRATAPARLFLILALGWLAAASSVAADGTRSKDSHAPKTKKEAFADSEFTIEPPPKWVSEVIQDPAPRLPRAAMHLALVDQQTRLDREGVARFVHKIRVVNDAAGLTSASQIQIDFDPLYQKLVLHDIAIWRGGKRLNKLDRKQITLLHRERQLEAQIYDGRMTASRVLDDVRVGDRIEWSYSLRGDNPVFGGKFVDIAWSSTVAGPVALFQYRLLAPQGRAIHVQTGGDDYGVSTEVRAGVRETLIRRHDIAQLDADASAPASAYLPEQVQLSEYADWGDVAQWAQQLFLKALEPSPEVVAQAAVIRDQTSTPEERLRRALDFVQSQIRYFGTELGEYSHQPASAAKVLQQRFGDCKDKVALLLALLRELGIEAQPALVSIYFRESVADMLPSPLAFNHVIARVEAGGKVYWLDATRAYQTGALDDRGSLGLGKALIAQDGGVAPLVDTPGPEREVRVEAQNTLRVTTFPAEPRLEVRIGYRGDLAELIRASLANRPQAEFEKAVVGDYVRAFPGAREVGEMQVQEDPTNNALTLLLQFSLPDYWRYPDQQRLAGNFWLVSAMSALRPTSQAPRTRPLRIAYPGIYRESFAVAFPEDVYSKPSSSRFDEQNKFFSYHLHQEALSRENRVTAELQLPKSQVETADWPDYMAQVTKVWPHLGGTVFVPTIDPVHFDKLRSDGQALTEDMRKGKVKVKTATQIKAQMTVLFMNAQIDGGRLAPKLLAQALVQRAEQYDHLGSYDRARADLQTATELDPSYAEGHAALAVNAMLAGRDEQVEEEVSKALALAPNDVAPRYTLLFSSYQRGLYQQARDEALELLANPAEVDRSYAAVWLYLASRRMGESGEKAVEGHLASGANPAWPFPVVQLLTGKIDMGQAEKAASDNGQPNAEKMCELYYYAAELAVINGDRGKARKFLRSSLETGVVEFNEYAFAQRGLGRLESAR